MILMGIILSAAPALPKFPQSITLVCEEWPQYTNQDGTGAYWEIVKTIFEPAGIKINTKIVPWKRGVLMVDTGKAHAIVGAYYDKQRDGNKSLYPFWHISVEEPVVAVVKKGLLPHLKERGQYALSGLVIGWIRGYDFDKTSWWKVKVERHEVGSVPAGLMMTAIDRIDALIDYPSTIGHAMESEDNALFSQLKIYHIKDGEKLYLQFSNTKLSKDLIKLFDHRMNLLSKTNTIETIYEKWGFSPEKFGKHLYTGTREPYKD